MSEPLRIAFFTDSYLPSVDGVVTSIRNTKAALERKGHKVYIFAPLHYKDFIKNEHKRQKDVIYIPGIKFKRYPQYNISIFPIYIIPKIVKYDFSVIHLHTPFILGFSGLTLARLIKVPTVATFHTLFMSREVLKQYGMIKGLSKASFLWKYSRFFYNKVDRVIAPSESIKALLEKHKIENIEVIPNGIDLKRFNYKIKADSIRAQIARDNEIVIGYIGRLSLEKHVETLIKAAKILIDKGYNIKLLIGGTGPAENRYKREVLKAGIGSKTVFTGFIDDRLLPKYYAALDLYCIPSTFETQGLTVLEAMAMNKPVVGADKYAIKDIIRNGYNGEIFRSKDPISCANSIIKVIENRDTYKGMLSTANKYDIEALIDRLINLYAYLK
ncbi:MAG: glycosyl transferase family 1 [Candidatus Micrarchaeota archaeon]|nr:MAG: glycosyl transferase family 1 [Candidatus Micrarchaeota archaeon]